MKNFLVIAISVLSTIALAMGGVAVMNVIPSTKDKLNISYGTNQLVGEKNQGSNTELEEENLLLKEENNNIREEIQDVIAELDNARLENSELAITNEEIQAELEYYSSFLPDGYHLIKYVFDFYIIGNEELEKNNFYDVVCNCSYITFKAGNHENLKFVGWSLTPGGELIPADYLVESSIVLYAVYEEQNSFLMLHMPDNSIMFINSQMDLLSLSELRFVYGNCVFRISGFNNDINSTNMMTYNACVDSGFVEVFPVFVNLSRGNSVVTFNNALRFYTGELT